LEILRLTTEIVELVALPPLLMASQSAVIVWSVCEVTEQV
jgi:hypothetical protein